MLIDKREANNLINVIESLLNSLDKTFDSLPTDIDQKVKDAKLTLLNVERKNDRQRIQQRFHYVNEVVGLSLVYQHIFSPKKMGIIFPV